MDGDATKNRLFLKEIDDVPPDPDLANHTDPDQGAAHPVR